MIPLCPRCGKTSRTFVYAQASGKWTYLYNENGSNDETLNDLTYGTLSKTVRCDECGKIRRDLVTDKGRTVSRVQPKETV